MATTSARAQRGSPRPDGPLTNFASPRGEKYRPNVMGISRQPGLCQAALSIHETNMRGAEKNGSCLSGSGAGLKQ